MIGKTIYPEITQDDVGFHYPFLDEINQRIIFLIYKGYTQKEIALEFGLCRSTIVKRIRKIKNLTIKHL